VTNRFEEESTIAAQLDRYRRKVDFDTYDITVQQLLAMLDNNAIDIAPKYQRRFRWENNRCSQLIESFYLGIPVPSLFMATNRDSTWELVDGVQRLSALVKFAGSDSLREKMKINPALQLEELEKLTAFNGLRYSDLPQSIQLQFQLRPVKVVTLSDKSDKVVRFDLFERLNKGGVLLTAQEIRDCVFRGRFSQELDDWAKDENFRKAVRLTATQETDGTREECVLRFFAFLHNYKEFVHSVVGFLNEYMKTASEDFNYRDGTKAFSETFRQLAAIMPNGITRPGRKTTTTPLNLFEGVAVGAALALKKKDKLERHGIKTWLASEELRRFTTGATNNLSAVKGRIEFCRDRFLGK
jgi:Protein of unknown function DUF262